MRIFWRRAAFFAAISFLGVASPPAAQRVTVPGGTRIAYRVTGDVSSSTAKVGDTFPIRAVRTVAVDGWVVVARGATGEGQVVAVDRAGPHGHAGSLKVRTDWIYGVDGNKIQLTDQDRTARGRSEKGKASTLTVVSAVFLGIPGLFAHNFVRGKDVTIDRHHTYHAFVDQSVYVASSQRRMAASGFAPAATATSTP